MPYEYKLTRRVEFVDTDMAGIMHFSNFLRFMEMTEHAFIRSLGFSIHQEVGAIKTGWPRVHVECDFIQPLYCEDEVEIHLLVAGKREKSISYQFIFRKCIDGEPGDVIAHGKSTAVCIGFGRSGKINGAIPIPEPISKKIQQAPPELLRA